MFQQINDSFKQGTQECKAVSSNMKKLWFYQLINIKIECRHQHTQPTATQCQVSNFYLDVAEIGAARWRSG